MEIRWKCVIVPGHVRFFGITSRSFFFSEDVDTSCFRLLSSFRKRNPDAGQSANQETRRKKDYSVTIKGKEIDLGQLDISEIERLCHECSEPHKIEKVSLRQTSLTYVPGSLHRFRNLCFLDFSNNKIRIII